MNFTKNLNKLIELTKPEPKQLVFLVEWLIFLFLLFFQGKMVSLQTWGVALCPFLFFYFIGGILFCTSKKIKKLFDTKFLILIAFGLFLIDQLIKIFVITLIPINSSIPIIPGWFEITHRLNPHGAWIFTSLSDDTIPLITPFMKLFLLSLTLLIIPIYQYLESRYGKIFWMQVSFVCIFSAFLSWLVDMFTRGYIVDFIGLPGLVAADLKDIFAYIGAAAIIIQAMEDPETYLKWKGWRSEIKDIGEFSSSVKNFIIKDTMSILNGIKSIFLKTIQ